MSPTSRAALTALVAALATTGALAAGHNAEKPRSRALPTGHNPENPPPAHTGGFGEPTCHACHFDNALDSGPGTLTLDGVPTKAHPGATHRITIRLAQPEMRRAGFMLSTRTADGTQAGALRATDTRATVTVANDVAYAHHTLAGSEVSGDSTAWVVEWTTPDPAAGDSVYFHLTANAGNDDASPFGDRIYSRVFVVEAGS